MEGMTSWDLIGDVRKDDATIHKGDSLPPISVSKIVSQTIDRAAVDTEFEKTIVLYLFF